jgi:DNA-binding HxlR family transcriptional regulator
LPPCLCTILWTLLAQRLRDLEQAGVVARRPVKGEKSIFDGSQKLQRTMQTWLGLSPLAIEKKKVP